jgi:hypothetical protein
MVRLPLGSRPGVVAGHGQARAALSSVASRFVIDARRADPRRSAYVRRWKRTLPVGELVARPDNDFLYSWWDDTEAELKR